jgi:hypothetical protein
MNAGTLKMTGLAGLVWGVLTILLIIVGIVFAVSAVRSGTAGTTPTTAAGTGIIVQIVGVLASLALCWMLFNLSQVYGGGMGAMACYAAIALVLIKLVLDFILVSGTLSLILIVLQGIAIIFVGAFGIMGKRLASGAFKAFCVLMIITGASLALIVTAVVYPFLALATGIVAFVAFNGASKQAV